MSDKKGCWRSHPHEEMNDECRQMTVLARANSKLRVAAQALLDEVYEDPNEVHVSQSFIVPGAALDRFKAAQRED